jgi:hypothetical protein
VAADGGELLLLAPPEVPVPRRRGRSPHGEPGP